MRHSAVVRTFRFAVVLTLALASGIVQRPARASSDSEFVGSTPCDTVPRRFLAIPAGASCERISWHLTLSSESKRDGGTYSLKAVFGIQARNDPGFVDGGRALRQQGTWTTVTGTPPVPGTVVYRFAAATPQRSFDFVLLSENLLHPLNENSALMVGNASWSYTLSRRLRVPHVPLRSGALQSTAGTAAGVFEGRTPCQGIVRLLNVVANPQCTKMKWRLTLAPNTYKLESSVQRDPPRTGTWSVRASGNDPARVVYDLDPQPDGAFLSFFKADDNHLLFLDKEGHLLVGDADFSYTLNRTK